MEPAARSGRAVSVMAMPSEETIRAQLSRIPEPCGILMRSPLDICQMGLVDRIECADGHVRVELVLTDSSCVHFTGLRRYITDLLCELPGVETVEVTASTTVLWTPDRITKTNN
ncbi:iron-sulfur cluster assembly protein [Nonomuraea purpurea]|uniref:Iron-sulfur cluster assembly protein n=1 Tax=Nonomuraea purpurea TaxID=1849276 RepID=A0ABV8GAZ0_9ACTN